MTEYEMVGWNHQLNGHEFERTAGDGEGQGTLACWSPWGCRERLTITNNRYLYAVICAYYYICFKGFHLNACFWD